MKYKAGFCQFNPEFLAREKNLERMVSQVSATKADLIVFPELATSGYTFSSVSEVEQSAETSQNGLTAIVMRKAAWENQCSIVVGFAEKDGNHIYNSAMLINPNGECHVYRKTHLFLEEKKIFSPGNTGFQVFSAKHDVKVGMMICWDWIFPESARTLMLKGAQIIAHPANLVLPWCQQAMLIRSLENRIFTITANRTGFEKNGRLINKFTGHSQVTGTKGDLLLQASEKEEYIRVVEIETEEANDKSVTASNDLIADRRPEYYHS